MNRKPGDRIEGRCGTAPWRPGSYIGKHDGEPRNHFLMLRDDGVRGGGPKGAWVVEELRSPPATVPACDACGAESATGNKPDSYTTTSAYGRLHFCLSCWKRAGALDEAEARRKALAKDAPGSAGSVDAAHRETAGERPSGQSISVSTQPSEPGRPNPDPYAEHRDLVACLVEFEMTTDDAARIAAMQAKLDSARADLDRPMGEKRYGKPLAGGWDSDDVDDGYCTF